MLFPCDIHVSRLEREVLNSHGQNSEGGGGEGGFRFTLGVGVIVYPPLQISSNCSPW